MSNILSNRQTNIESLEFNYKFYFGKFISSDVQKQDLFAAYRKMAPGDYDPNVRYSQRIKSKYDTQQNKYDEDILETYSYNKSEEGQLSDGDNTDYNDICDTFEGFLPTDNEFDYSDNKEYDIDAEHRCIDDDEDNPNKADSYKYDGDDEDVYTGDDKNRVLTNSEKDNPTQEIKHGIGKKDLDQLFSFLECLNPVERLVWICAFPESRVLSQYYPLLRLRKDKKDNWCFLSANWWKFHFFTDFVYTIKGGQLYCSATNKNILKMINPISENGNQQNRMNIDYNTFSEIVEKTCKECTSFTKVLEMIKKEQNYETIDSISKLIKWNYLWNYCPTLLTKNPSEINFKSIKNILQSKEQSLFYKDYRSWPWDSSKLADLFDREDFEIMCQRLKTKYKYYCSHELQTESAY